MTLGLSEVKEFGRCVKPVRRKTGSWQTDRQTDRHCAST